MKRSLSLDIYKIILCILLIALHLYPLSGTYDNVLEWQFRLGVARIIVPSFFIINGYFLLSKIENWKDTRKYLTHLLVVFIVWSTFYLQFYYENYPLTYIIKTFVTGYYHLWYLSGLLYGVLIFYFIRKYIKKDIYLIALAATLYLIGHLDEISQVIPNFILQLPEGTFKEETIFYKNGVFLGLPYIMMGYFLRKWDIKRYFTSYQLSIICLLSFGLLTLESHINNISHGVCNFIISAPFFAPAIILLLLKHPIPVTKSAWTEYFGHIPNGVYYIHLFFVFKVYSGYNNIYNVPVVFVSSVLVTIVLIFVNKRIKIFL